MQFRDILEFYRKHSYTEKDKGWRFEKLIKAFFKTDPRYAHLIKDIWLWNEFFGKDNFGGSDIGIDIVIKTTTEEFWAVQCKFYAETATIDKPAVDSFLSTSSKSFISEDGTTAWFSRRLFVSTTNQWGSNAEIAISNQNPPVIRINLSELEDAPVNWEKLFNDISGESARIEKFPIRPHQKEALDKSIEYFKTYDRGKLIMACGTGKTYTSLKIAETLTGGDGLVLFLVPSIALLGQTLREWASQANEPLNPILVCSDSGVGRNNEDDTDINILDLPLPATTDTFRVASQIEKYIEKAEKKLTVIFSTYQSIEVVSKAQKLLKQSGAKKYKFDVVICDEAHRTTGVQLKDEDQSAFIKVHSNDNIEALKRIYMTATPRLYSLESQTKAAINDALLCSMDDPEIYGDEIYRIGFGEAVDKNLLSDYKVLVLTVSEDNFPQAYKKLIEDPNHEITSSDASKIIGCINALSKKMMGDASLVVESDPNPMKTAVAFCSNIRDSKKITEMFNSTKNIYYDSLTPEERAVVVNVDSDHIDGAMNAPLRDRKLSWLKSVPKDSQECRILTNVRCLSEGVDVPALDAVIFMSSRNSQVDVVQSVGRVMRKSPGKKYGYIIIPVLIPTIQDAKEALDNNERFRVVWTVLNALRAHDDRFNALVNKIDLNKSKQTTVLTGGPDLGRGDNSGDGDKPLQGDGINKEIEKQLRIYFEEFQDALYARMVLKVGDKHYWEQWAKDLAQIAENHISRIQNLINSDGSPRKVFNEFITGLQKNINPSISEEEAIEMLAQHLITKPVFEALFENYSFVRNNPISQSMQNMLDVLEEHAIEKEVETLEKFYESVKKRVDGIDNAEGKQKIIVELYDKFFKIAFPRMVERLGIVYTPIEVVDFIIHSVDEILKREFDRSLSDENIHIIDPFTGTGTFITRLLQSGLIKKEDLYRKYTKEIHANEIVLLAYYIATVNIEMVYHDIVAKENEYKAFDGICLTDTFQLGETDVSEKLFSNLFPQNSDRVIAQKKAPMRVIIGNPPYSIGQKSANDNAQNQSYPLLDDRISKTYAKHSSAGLNKSLYDAYIKAFRWSSDRLDKNNGGIICFVSNGAWLDGNSTDGFRKCLEKEFSSIYIFNLRGNQRTSGELSRKEGGKIFGSGSRTPIAITLLVKNPNIRNEKATIFYHDIGDYLNRNEKLEIIKGFQSFTNPSMNLNTLIPNEFGDWTSVRNSLFDTYLPIEPNKKFDINSKSFFNTYAIGVATNRDAWVYNFSKVKLSSSMKTTINVYNEQVGRLLLARENNPKVKSSEVISSDHQKISWTVNLIKDFEKGINHSFVESEIIIGTYRPFLKLRLYFDKPFIERPGLWTRLFPSKDSKNFIISITGIGGSKEFSVLITDNIPNLHLVENGQYFPLYYYEENNKTEKSLFDDENNDSFIRKDAISNFMLQCARIQYGKNVTKEDIFYYVYGILHSTEYKATFVNDLKKMLPRLPLLESVKDFWAFSKAGRELAELHLHYENVSPYPGVIVNGDDGQSYKVGKMRFPSKGQKDTIIYNSKITILNIPEEAYEYVVNGKSAIEWIMERYQVTIDKKSGIRNDPNDWATEVGNPKYILDLLLSIINVSVKTMEIVKNLPKVKFE